MNEVNLAEQSSFVWAIISHHSIVVVSNNGDEIEKIRRRQLFDFNIHDIIVSWAYLVDVLFSVVILFLKLFCSVLIRRLSFRSFDVMCVSVCAL